MSVFSIVVPDDYLETTRIDKYISSIETEMNRSKLKSGLEDLKVNGKKQKLSYKIKAGDKIEIEWVDNVPDDIEPENIPLDIVYEDENVTVINKKQGMVTHPAAGNWTGTLVNALLYHWKRQSLSKNESNRPGIVHRLDKDTSGTIITAKNRDTEEWLQKQIRNHSTKKEYILIVTGRPKKSRGVIKTQIIRDPHDRKKFKAVTDTDAGKSAVTYYRCICSYGNYTLIRVRLGTGRTHQIRVHMKYLGCPILGDSIYNHVDSRFTKATLMLHARQLSIMLPGEKDFRVFKSEIPQRFKDVVRELRGTEKRVKYD